MSNHNAHRVCPFCEATCGVVIEVDGNAIASVRGDKDDPFSRGFICPKAHGLKTVAGTLISSPANPKCQG